MKRIVIIKMVFILFVAGFTACEKIEQGTPPEIRKLIREQGFSYCKVIECDYNGENVYDFIPHSDMSHKQGRLYDAKGNLLCEWGGYANPIGCGQYDGKLIEKRIIWKNKKGTC
jgi:hypothetical protein